MSNFLVDVPEGKAGPWKVTKFTVLPNDPKAFHYALHGRPVPPGTYTRLTHDGEWEPIMSDTPAEIRDHLDFIRRATGKVLINGLGLGVVLKGLLAKPEVTQVDVVENSTDVITLVWPTYAEDPRAVLHHADAFTIQWPKGTRWDYVWHDIWSSICTDNLPEITRLKRKYARMTDWQGAWVEHLLRHLKAQGR